MTNETLLQSRDREFHFTRRDFERIRELIYRHAGITVLKRRSRLLTHLVAGEPRAQASA